MAQDGSISINGTVYPISYESTAPSGRRAFLRTMRPSQPSDPSRIGTAMWQLGGAPIGRSREGADGVLALDYADNIETYYDDLLTASPAPNDVTLTATDPPGIVAEGEWGNFKWGINKWGSGTTGIIGESVTDNPATHADVQSGYLFIGRGFLDTQVNSSFSPVSSAVFGSNIAGKANWQNAGWLGLGFGGVAMQKRTGVTTTSATYTAISVSGNPVYAGELKRGNDRLWLVDAQNNQVRYTFDDFTTISNPLTVGDDAKQLTGIGTLGPYTIVGALDGLFGFTDSGKPVMVDDLEGEDSPNNGLRHTSLWGWDYFTTDLGIKAWAPNVTNPVGLEALQNFEGPIDGRPTALWSWRSQLFAAYLTTSGDTYIVRGVYGPDTANSGQPLWYPFKKLSSVECHLLYATPRSFATNPRIVAGRGTNITTYIMGRRGRDIADANYAFSTEGGDWYGTTMTRGAALHKNLRWASFQTEQCAAGKSWQLAVSCDGGSYVNVGSAVTSNGHQIVRPVSGGVPLTTVTFHTLKPKFTQVNNSSTTPPQIRGHLTVEWDERPDMVEEVQVTIDLEVAGWWDNIKTLVGHSTESPVAISLPGDTATYYGFVVGAPERRDREGDGVGRVALQIILWSTS